MKTESKRFLLFGGLLAGAGGLIWALQRDAKADTENGGGFFGLFGGGNGAADFPPFSGRVDALMYRASETPEVGGYTVEVNKALGFGPWLEIGSGWEREYVEPNVRQWLESQRG